MAFLIRKYIILLVLLSFQSVLTFAQDGNIPPVVLKGVSIPSDFPQYNADINEETAPGYIFLANSEGMPYLMILENDGTPYFYRKLKDHSLDFKLQANGQYTRWIDEDVRGYEVMDEHFQILDTLKCQNGFETDEHELQLLPNGHALMIAHEERSMALIDPNNNPNATVIGNHIQELDANGTVVFQWLCWDHFNLEDTYRNYTDALQVDYVHMNSIAVDFDGHLLISSRHLSECTKIDRQSGEIIWRLGGKNNQFDFVNDTSQIYTQHDFRPVPGKPNYYTLFDNGSNLEPRFSRAVEFRLDTVNMTAEKIWEYRHNPDRYSRLMGNAQRLSNGNTLINWGHSNFPKITEVTPGGSVVYEANFTPEMNNYRTFRFECTDFILAPYLIAEPYPDRIRLLFNKFGDNDVDYFNIYGGTDPEQLVWLDSSSITWKDLLDLEASMYYYLEVRAVDASGVESNASNREKVYVRNSKPGDNLILNGNFTQGMNFWALINDRGASSTGFITDSSYRFNITNPGQVLADVQLYQDDIPLVNAKEYILELDARADSPRFIDVELERAGIPWTSYSRHGQSYITDQFTHIEHTFIMEEANDLHAKFVISGGEHDIDFEVKNISLRQVVSTGVPVIQSDLGEISCYPNPADRNLHISYQLETASSIHLQLFTLSGQLIETIYQGNQTPGFQEHVMDTESLAEGAYMLYYRSGSKRQSSIILVQH